MLTYPDIDPVLISMGPLQVHWYGVTYLLGFLCCYTVAVWRRERVSPAWNVSQISDLLFYVAVGIILGGRAGYILFYQFQLVFLEPWTLFEFWLPGRSFHGGLLGVIVAVWLFCRVHRRFFFEVMDFAAPVVPIGLGLGRLGNFINGELWGRVTEVPWGMVFPHAGPLPRHPSQIYEFFLEGICLFVILMVYARKPRARGAISGLFLIAYGLFRCLVELWREPDVTHGFIAFHALTMGQLLSVPMILLGLYLMVWAPKSSALLKK